MASAFFFSNNLDNLFNNYDNKCLLLVFCLLLSHQF